MPGFTKQMNPINAEIIPGNKIDQNNCYNIIFHNPNPNPPLIKSDNPRPTYGCYKNGS
jgi:hypothetical protein